MSPRSASNNNDILSIVSTMSGQSLEQISSMSRDDRARLVESVVTDPGFPDRFRAHNINSREQLSGAIENSVRKGWFAEYVKGEKGWLSFGTLGKLLTMKPVEGVVNTLTFNQVPWLGKMARWAAVIAAAYFGVRGMFNAMNAGHQIAGEGASNILGRVGPGGAHLFPEVYVTPAAPINQALPPLNPGATM